MTGITAMRLEVLRGQPPAWRLWSRLPDSWRWPIAQLALAWGAVVLVLRHDLAAMAGQWWDSSTYNHVLLIPLILGWLVAMRWPRLSMLTPTPWRGGLVLFVLTALGWVLGSMAELAQVRELALVLMLQSAVAAVLGLRVAAGLLFPLGYMLFLVPAGDELIPLLQTITARITTVLLALAHIPAKIDGVFIATPAGYFKVAEACSGVKFLIAMMAYGTLVAHVCFRNPKRRALFMLACLVTPVLANGVRAWGTIAIAQAVGIQFAAGFDHVFYGWIFFALVMGLVMAAGWRWFDRAVDDPMIDAGALERSPQLEQWSGRILGPHAALGAMGAILIVALSWTSLAAGATANVPRQIDLPQVSGWRRVAYSPRYPWSPLFTGADHRLLGRYADQQGHVVDVAYALYGGQGEGRKADGFGQGAVPLGSKWAWSRPGPMVAGQPSTRIEAPGPTDRLALSWFRHGETVTSSRLALKLALLADRLLLRARPTATLIVSAEDGGVKPADQSLDTFLKASGPISTLTAQIGGER
jgi:exosortase A